MSEAGSIPYALPGGQLTRKDLVRIAKDLSATKGASTSLLELTSHWLQIIAAFGLYYLFPAWWTAIALFIFIGARQYAILIMLHEAQHTLLHPNKRINNAIATWLIAAPCGTIFENSQKTHLAHHFNLGDEHRDPAFYIYCTGRPTPKKLLGDFVRFYLSRIGGQKIWALIMGETKHLASPPEKSDKATVLKEAFRKVWPVAAVQLLILGILASTIGWYAYILFWFLPLLLMVVMLDDFRLFCEHSNVGLETLDKDHLLITYMSNPIERFFVSPNHMNYHAEHHLFPFVPHRQLSKLRVALRRCPELNENIQFRSSYLRHFLNYIASESRAPRHVAAE